MIFKISIHLWCLASTHLDHLITKVLICCCNSEIFIIEQTTLSQEVGSARHAIVYVGGPHFQLIFTMGVTSCRSMQTQCRSVTGAKCFLQKKTKKNTSKLISVNQYQLVPPNCHPRAPRKCSLLGDIVQVAPHKPDNGKHWIYVRIELVPNTLGNSIKSKTPLLHNLTMGSIQKVILSRSIELIYDYLILLKCLWPLISADAKTSAPAWPNLSSGCLSGRNLYVEPTARPAAAETKPEQGEDN